MITHISKKLTGGEQSVITTRKTITIRYKSTRKTRRKIKMNEYKHANKMKKEKKNLSSPLKASWNQRSKKRARVKTKSPIKASESMLGP